MVCQLNGTPNVDNTASAPSTAGTNERRVADVGGANDGQLWIGVREIVWPTRHGHRGVAGVQRPPGQQSAGLAVGAEDHDAQGSS